MIDPACFLLKNANFGWMTIYQYDTPTYAATRPSVQLTPALKQSFAIAVLISAEEAVDLLLDNLRIIFGSCMCVYSNDAVFEFFTLTMRQ